MQTGYAYMLLTFSAAAVMLVLSCMLLVIRIPREERTRKLRVARLCLAVSYFVLSVPHFIECCCKTNPDVDTRMPALLTLATAAFQSLLFTATMLTFILPNYVTRRRTLCQMGAVMIAVAIFLVAVFACRNPYPVLYAGLAAYFGQITYYTWLFRRKYRESLQRLENYYDEDESKQLRWVKCGFYAALCIGIAASVSVYFPAHFAFYFTVVYIVFYVWFASRFSNYAAKLNYYLPAVEKPAEEPRAADAAIARPTNDELSAKKAPLRLALEQWVADKKFVRPDITLDSLAAELNTNKAYLSRHINSRYGQNFRSWINSLRIAEAQKLIETRHDLSPVEISEQIGIPNSSTFYRSFATITGVTPAEYRRRHNGSSLS